MNKYKSQAIAVDFDGVIAEFSDGIEEFGKLIPGAKEAMAELRRLGYKIIIHTARPSRKDHLDSLANYLTEKGIPFDEINTNSDCEWKSTKPIADIYIDDRACRFEGNWEKTLADTKRHLGLSNNCPDFCNYERLLSKIKVRTKQVSKFEEFLRKETNWLTAPASTRFHLSEKGGLIKHSVNVANMLLKLSQMLSPELSEESCLIVALYHDVGKVGYAGNSYYIKTNEHTSEEEGARYRINPDCTYMDIATRSLYLVSQYIELSPEEAQATRYHDGQYIPENRGVAHRESKLTRLLQYADNWCGDVLEERRL